MPIGDLTLILHIKGKKDVRLCIIHEWLFLRKDKILRFFIDCYLRKGLCVS